MDLFLFQEGDFEGESFDAPAFVAKYRRVNSLESLKEQLRQYCEMLRQQLYTVINKDYKDFITIATKLDGVDSRVELLRKPLVDLRLDLSLLHDGLLSSKQAIQDTMSRKSEVSSKKKHIMSALLCLEKLDIAENVVGGNAVAVATGSGSGSGIGSGGGGGGGGGSSSSGSGGATRTRRDLLQALRRAKGAPGSAVSSGLSASAFDSSELERAAHALAQAQVAFATFTQQPNTPLPASLQGLSRTLSQRINVVMGQLLSRIKTRLADVLAEASSSSAGDGGGSGSGEGAAAAAAAGSDSMKRSLAHCLRALSALQRGDVAESAISEYISPLVKSTLTLGRIDGAGGRGSYSGLREALMGLLVTLGRSLSAPLTLAEGVIGGRGVGDSESESQADLLVCGVWVPVVNVLQERFPGLFSVGIATTLARCYRAVDSFTLALVDLIDFSSLSSTAGGMGSRSVSVTSMRAAVLARVLAHPSVTDVHDRWDLSLYEQLRVQEVSARLERAFEVAATQGLTAKAYDAIHSVAASATAPSTPTPVPAPASSSSPAGAVAANVESNVVPIKALAQTLTSAELAELRTQCSLGPGVFHLPVVLACAVEAATCLHTQVLLTPILPEMLALSLRCVARLETHIAAVVDVPTPAFPRGAASLSASVSSSFGADQQVTPSKSSSSIAAPSTPGVSSSSASADELALLTADLFALARWLRTTLQRLAFEQLPPTSKDVAAAQKAITACVNSECRRVDGTRSAVWGRLAFLLGAECKRTLLAVKAVAGKYRMTNKPAPDTASPYVESILAPLKPFAPAGWDAGVIEEVTAIFLVQVQSLMETVKQMDSALQRRSKARSGPTTGAGATSGALSDSDKIALQISLDVKAYGAEITALGVDIANVPSFAILEAEVDKVQQ